MYIFELVIPELADVGFIVDEISQLELVVDYPCVQFEVGHFECEQFV